MAQGKHKDGPDPPTGTDSPARSLEHAPLRTDEYRQLVELSPDTIAVHENGILLYANSATATLVGAESVDDILGRSVAELVAPESRDRIRSLLKEVQDSGPSRRILVTGLLLANGRTVDIEISSAPVTWDGRPARQVVARDVTEQRLAEARLLETRQQLQTLLDHAPEAVVVYDADTLTFVDLNTNAERLFGLTREDLLHVGPERLSPERQPDGTASKEAAKEKIEAALAGHSPVFDWCHVHSSGREIQCEIRLVRLPSAERRLVRGSILDITQRKRVEQELRASEERFSKVFHASPVGITISRLSDARFLTANDSFLAMTGYERDEVVGHRAEELELWIDGETRRAIGGAVRSDEPYLTVEGRLRTKTGELRHILASFARIQVGGEDCILALGSDISERKAFEEQLRHLAFHDPLTGLPNRALFEDRLDQALKRSRADHGTVAVLFLDLDRFKVVNDTLGHTAGDGLLSDVAKRLRRNLPEEDTLARFGGDEFAILLENVRSRRQVRRAVQRLIDALEAPFHVMETRVHVTASIGVAFSGGDGEEPDDLIRYMDIAMYRAKQEEGSEYRIFDRRRDSAATRRLHRENELRQAMEHDQLELRFQPIVSLDRGTVHGVEALLRWRHPEHGLISPPEFVPLAEELGLIVPMGEWVLLEACRHAADWRERLADEMIFRLSVNLSARQLQVQELAKRVEEILVETGFPAEALELELTENVAVQATEQLRRLRSVGVRLALDDFGTGYASLSYLRQLEVDTLKIDQSFIHGLEQPGADETLVRSILFLGEQLGLEVTAEGVETRRQANRLRDMACRRAQGFYFARPIPAAQIERILGRTLPETPHPSRQSA
jgi:Amt family ammonium transporter